MNLLRVTHLALLISLFTISAETHAQLSIGVRGGVNFSSIKVKESLIPIDFTIKRGANFALLLNKPISPLLSLQIEPGFSQLGANTKDVSWSNTINKKYEFVEETKLSINYFELPLLLQLRPKLGIVDFIISAGPQLRYLAKAKSEFTSTTYADGTLEQTTTEKETLTGEDSPKNFEWGISSGIGIAVSVSKFKIFAEGRYTWGLSNTNKLSDDAKVYNNVSAVNLGVLIPIQKK